MPWLLYNFLPICRNNPDLIYDIMEPYGKDVARMMHVLTLAAVSLYFITSSDSGSYVDDILSSNGFGNPPITQKVYWAVTEGACATALVVAGGATSLSALQAVSICAGFPYTVGPPTLPTYVGDEHDRKACLLPWLPA